MFEIKAFILPYWELDWAVCPAKALGAAHRRVPMVCRLIVTAPASSVAGNNMAHNRLRWRGSEGLGWAWQGSLLHCNAYSQFFCQSGICSVPVPAAWLAQHFRAMIKLFSFRAEKKWWTSIFMLIYALTNWLSSRQVEIYSSRNTVIANCGKRQSRLIKKYVLKSCYLKESITVIRHLCFLFGETLEIVPWTQEKAETFLKKNII